MKKLCITLILMLLFFGCKKTTEVELKTRPIGGDFQLQSESGTYSLTQSRGKVVLIYFGFTSCPDVCPTTLSNASQAFKNLKPNEIKNTLMLFITVDPERDTLNKLQEYSKFFHPQILALTGSVEDIRKAASLYGATFKKQELSSHLGYTMDHTTSVFVVNKEGKLVGAIPHGSSPDEFKTAIRKALN